METIIYQSCINPLTQFPIQQLSNLNLNGISTISDNFTCDSSGKLYATYSKDTMNNYTLSIYNDVTQINKIAFASSATFGVTEIGSVNSSGITGSVNFIQYTAEDSLINIQVLLTNDNDIPLGELQVLNDYDINYGFASFHVVAFEQIKRIVTSKYRSLVYNKDYIDTKQINGGIGGYDLSFVYDWYGFKEASAQYVLYKIAERQYIEGGSVWEKRSKEAFLKFKAYMETVEVQLDLTKQRIDTKQRTGNTFKISRA